MRLLVSGTTRTLARLLESNRDVLGLLTSPPAGNRVGWMVETGLPWGCDNGAFTGLDIPAFRRLVSRVRGRPGLLWVVCPDTVGDASATLSQFHEWRPWLEEQGVPIAFVGQDGAEETPIPWGEFQAWFIGGSTRWKLSQESADLAFEAKRRGKWVHMGRVNSMMRLRAAYDMGCDSVDGTEMSRWGDKHLEKFCHWVRVLQEQPTLFREW